MAAQRSGQSGSYTRGDWKHFLKFGGLLAAVAGTLILGAVLRTDDVRVDGTPPSAFVEFVESPAGEAGAFAGADDGHALEPAEVWDEAAILEGVDDDANRTDDRPTEPPPPVDDPLDPLARRADADLQRLESARGWTLQFLMACDPANVRPPVDALGSSDDLYLLPTFFDGRACFRLCWGVYPSREAAVGARPLPAALLAITDTPQPVPVEQAVR